MMWLAAAALVVLLLVASSRTSRARAIERLRLEWGTPSTRRHKLEHILAAHRSRVAVTGARAMDERTCADLDLDAVFAAIDRTESTLGQHALYHRLRSTPLGDRLEDFEALTARMSDDRAARERAQLALGWLRDPHGYDLWWLARADAIEVRPWHAVFPALTVAVAAVALGAMVSPELVPLLIAICAVNVGVRFATDNAVSATASAFRQIAPVVATAESLAFIGDAGGPLTAPLVTDVSGLRRLKTIARWVTGDPFMLGVSPNPLAGMASDVAKVLYEYLNYFLLLDSTGVYIGASDLRARGASLTRVVSAIGEVDSAISVASYRAERADWTRPRFLPAGAPSRLVDVRHPLVADAVPNSIVLRPGHGVLVTGSNMSGKSTFLRTIGITTVLAQTIHTCLAAEYEAPVVTVRSAIGRADDLLAGKSYYIVEVETLLSLVEASAGGDPHLFLLDELFRGTNATERIAAGQAVLTELVAGAWSVPRHIALAATHDGELVELLPDTYDAYHFGDEVRPDGLFFDHRLKTGPATSRNAIALLRIHGAPDRLVKSATACAETLDRLRGFASR